MRRGSKLFLLTTLLLSACGIRVQDASSFESSESKASSSDSGSSSAAPSAPSSSSSPSAPSTSSEQSHEISSEIEHHYSSEWSSDDEYHWHACTDEGYEELKSDYGRHQYELEDHLDPTFETEGLNVYGCRICHHVLEETIPVKEHNWSEEYLFYDHEYHIQFCVDEGYEELTKKSPHDYNIVTTDATFETMGLREYTCKQCGYYYEEIIPVKEHNYGEWTFHNTYDHIRYCTDEGYESFYQTQAHDMHEEVVEPTFEEGGYTHHWCSVCDYQYDDSQTSPKPHNYAKVWSYNETHHWIACVDEGYEDLKINYAEHGAYGHFENVDVAPTADAPGHAYYECNQCGYVYSEGMVDQLTQGMIFKLNAEGTAYSITGITQDYYDYDSHIPETYNNLPVTEIGDRAFKGVYRSSLTLPDNIASIGDEAFADSDLTEIYMGNNVIHIGDGAFKNTKITSVDLSSKLQTIGDSAFENTLIASFELPDSLHSIGDRAFANTPITEMTVPDNVLSVGFAVFSGCSNLTKVSLPFFGKTKDLPRGTYSTDTLLGHYFGDESYSNSTKYKQFRGVINSVTTYFETYIPSGFTDLVIRGGTIIPEFAFSFIGAIKNLYLPKTLTLFDYGCFNDMSGLKNLFYEGDITDWAGIDTHPQGAITGSSPFINNLDGLVFYLQDESGAKEFDGKHFYAPTEVVIDFCQQIPNLFLRGLTQLTSVTISNGVTSVGDFAFQNCTNLRTLIFPDSVVSMGPNVFTGCSKIQTLRLSANSSAVYRGEFDGLVNLRSVFMPSASGVDMLGDLFRNGDGTLVYQYPYANNTAYTRYIPSNLSDITIAGGDIHTGFFSGCGMVKKVTFGKDVTAYGKSMFRGSNGITELVFEQYPFNENSETEISESSLHVGYDCFSLGKLLSKYAFGGGQERLQLPVPDDRRHLPESQWYVIYEDATIDACRCYVPTSLKKIEIQSGLVGYYALLNLDPVEELTFGKDVTLQSFACSDMDNLKTVNLEAGVTVQKYHGKVFHQCPNLETINFKGTEEEFLAIQDQLGITSSYTVNYIA